MIVDWQSISLGVVCTMIGFAYGYVSGRRDGFKWGFKHAVDHCSFEHDAVKAALERNT